MERVSELFPEEPELIDDWEEEPCFGSATCLADLLAASESGADLFESDDSWD